MMDIEFINIIRYRRALDGGFVLKLQCITGHKLKLKTNARHQSLTDPVQSLRYRD